jgi:hypothetical protein
MGQGQKEWADVVVSGVVQGTGRSTQGSATYVRFQGYDGQLSVMVEDGVMPSPVVARGERVELVCKSLAMGKFGLVLHAVEVRRLGKVGKE